jgi:hypothetical protein
MSPISICCHSPMSYKFSVGIHNVYCLDSSSFLATHCTKLSHTPTTTNKVLVYLFQQTFSDNSEHIFTTHSQKCPVLFQHGFWYNADLQL